jgi:hypothetical protein
MEAMDHPYFYPVVKEQGRINTLSGGSPTTAGTSNAGVAAAPSLTPGTKFAQYKLQNSPHFFS